MANNIESENPELGDYSREELALRNELKEMSPIYDLSNSIENQAKIDPIKALESLYSRAKELLAKLI